MTLNFPRQDDVKLKRSPLSQVICQVRFSPILRIGSEQPHAFQEAIRHVFPGFEVDQSFSFQVPAVPALGTPHAPPSFQMAPSEFRFTSEDGHSTVTLAQNFFALSTDKYSVWEDFAAKLQLVSDAVIAEYKPSSILRVGLRYVNEIRAESLDLTTFEEVIALVQSDLVSPLISDAWSLPKTFATQLELEDGDSTLAIRLRLLGEEGSSRALALDFDYYQEGSLPFDNLIPRCDQFHSVIYDAFRWAIREDQFAIFEPMA